MSAQLQVLMFIIDKTAVVICRSMGFWNWSQEVMRPTSVAQPSKQCPPGFLRISHFH